jgi:Holliday junction resolvase
MGNYAAGYRLEHRVERLYAAYGWLSTRYPSSGRRLYPADVLAVKRLGGTTHIHLVECKNASRTDAAKRAIYVEASQIQKLLDEADTHGGLALVAYSFPRQHARVIRADQLKSSGKMRYLEREDGALITRFLHTFG